MQLKYVIVKMITKGQHLDTNTQKEVLGVFSRRELSMVWDPCRPYLLQGGPLFCSGCLALK